MAGAKGKGKRAQIRTRIAMDFDPTLKIFRSQEVMNI